MRVLQVHTRYREPGGEDGVVRNEADLLRSGGHCVDSLTFENPSGAAGAAAALMAAPWNPRSSARARQAIRDNPPDVVHAHNTWFRASPSVLAASRRRAPVVMTVHNYRLLCANHALFREGRVCTDCVGRSMWPGVVHRCYRGSVTASAAVALTTGVHRAAGTWDVAADRYLALSDFAAELLVHAGLPARRIARHDNFVPDPGPRSAPAGQSRTLLAVGRLTPEKGFDRLVEAWAGVAPAPYELIIVGDGPERRRLEAVAPTGVSFAGRLPPSRVSELMCSARALLVPSRWPEGQPLVVLEALAAGLPVAASDHPPLREVLEPAGQLLVGPGAVPSWEEALAALCGTELEGRSSAARRRYESSYRPAVALQRLERIYGDLVA